MILEYKDFIQPLNITNITHGYDSKTKSDRPLRVPFRLLHYVFNIKEIANEVYKRTSFIGKHRTTEQGMHLLDTYALTADDEPMFDTLCKEAAAAVYEKMLGFSQNDNNSFLYNENKKAVQLNTNIITNWQLASSKTTPPQIPYEQRFDSNDNTFHEIYRWKVVGDIDDGDKFRFKLKYKYKVINTFSELEERNGECVFEANCADCVTSGVVFYSHEMVFPLDIDTSAPSVAGLRSEEYASGFSVTQKEFAVIKNNEQTFNVGDWLLYNNNYYIAKRAFTNSENLISENGEPLAGTMELVPSNFLDSIIFTIAKPDYVAENSLKLTDRAIYEALVNYIIFKWFLIVAPNEADFYMNESVRRLGDIKKHLCSVNRFNNFSHPF